MTGRCGVVVGHGRFAEGLLSALSVVAGEQEHVWALSNQGRDGEELEAEIAGLLAAHGAGREAYLLSDIDGGTLVEIEHICVSDAENLRVGWNETLAQLPKLFSADGDE